MQQPAVGVERTASPARKQRHHRWQRHTTPFAHVTSGLNLSHVSMRGNQSSPQHDSRQQQQQQQQQEGKNGTNVVVEAADAMAKTAAAGREVAGHIAEHKKLPPQMRVLVPDHVPTPVRPIRSLELKQFLCGVLAGAVSGACTGPLEGVRTRVIARQPGADSAAHMAMQAVKRGKVVSSVLSVKGVATAAAMGAATRGVQFYEYEGVKKWATRHWPGHDPKLLPLPSAATPASSLAGAAGAFASTLATYPFSAIGDHMSLQPGKYAGKMDALRGVAQTYGASQLFRGIVPKMLSVVPAGAVNFYVFDGLKAWLQESKRRARGLPADADAPLHAVESLTIGGAAGACSTLLTYPLELARREINMSLLPPSATVTGGNRAFNGKGEALRGIVRGQGVKGLYRGVAASLLEIVPATAVSFMVYETAKRLFVAENQEKGDEVKG